MTPGTGETAAPTAAAADIVRLREIVVIGGGCYGTFYTRQLETARARGSAAFARILAVDHDAGCRLARELGEAEERRLVVRDWDEFLADWLADDARDEPGPPDVIVPSPLMPHLMYRWLIRRARERWPGRLVETRPVPLGPGTPYDEQAPDHTRYVSYADWICPTHCIEPARCPVIRAPRTWEMEEAAGALVSRLARGAPTAGPVLFHCRHTVFGVGTFPAAQVRAGDRRVAQAGAPGEAVDVLVGTVSSCHGALNLLHLGSA